ncbi:uncharacterized protein LOC129000216 [Macrosteles quadrilineatus]|uniref:uncharacterized protein LOC129000216 n=1 Tax=Macrosteles quadrilineatus TaxID=74068 RepID=UPI0023E24E55|nr:uncharacterized protein LOC129000216 [Macrosteles quadrilineatus]
MGRRTLIKQTLRGASQRLETFEQLLDEWIPYSTMFDVTHEDVLFHFGGREKQTVTVMVDPGQIVSQLVLCETPPIFAHLQHPDTTIPVEGTVEFLLATTDLYPLNPVAPVTLVATLRPNFFGAPATLAVPSDLPLYNGSDQTVVFRTTATGYTVQPSWFNIPPNQTLVVHVDIDDINPIRCGNLNLHTIFPKEERFKIELEKVTSLDSLEEGAPVAAEPTPSTSSGSGTPGPVSRVSLGDSKDLSLDPLAYPLMFPTGDLGWEP